MHSTAFVACERFYKIYGPFMSVLDVGSLDVNGALRPIFSDTTYIGLDRCEGDNVDVVFSGYQFPFSNRAFDAVVSSSCLEHDPAFWLTFREMARVCRKYIYINVPSCQGYHPYPVDCWRFLADAMPALADSVDNVKLVETFINPEKPWCDNVGIFQIVD